MCKRFPLRLLAVLLLAAPGAARALSPGLPPAILPNSLGVNIHFTDPRPGEMKMLAQGGFRWVRMDGNWDGTEVEPGRYDFSAYDRLFAALKPHGIRPVIILDYSSRFHDDGQSPRTAEGQAAFARWAAAFVGRFKGRGAIWEMYNEPNISFWRPKPDVDEYTRLALAVGKAIRAVAPHETYVGPATSTMDFGFLEACFKAGLLTYWDAVSVHPYRQANPESVSADYRRLRLLIAKYAPAGKQIPILSGEWGYSAGWSGMDEPKQGLMLARQFLTNIRNEIALSIWYDWHDDGEDPKEPEHHFGTVHNPYREGSAPVYEPKPAYLAARTLINSLRGFRFNKRLDTGDGRDNVLLFSRGRDVRIAAWTTAQEPHTITLPASPGHFRVTGHTGDAMPAATADTGGLRLTLTGAPIYLVPERPNRLLQTAASWERIAPEIVSPARSELTISLAAGDRAATRVVIDVPRSAEPLTVRVALPAGRQRYVQSTEVIATNPLRVTILPRTPAALPIQVENPSGEPFEGIVSVTGSLGLAPTFAPITLRLTRGQLAALVSVPLRAVPDVERARAYRAGVRITDRQGRLALAVPEREYRAVDNFGDTETSDPSANYRVVADGDPKVASEQSISSDAPPEGPPAAGLASLRLTYRFDPGWKFVRVTPIANTESAIQGRPVALGLWIHGDARGNSPRLRVTDTTGQTFQPESEPITWRGWRYMEFPLDGSRSGHWGGAEDGAVHYPLRWDTLFLLDGVTRNHTAGTVYIAGPTLIYTATAATNG